jgi:putative membrane protein
MATRWEPLVLLTLALLALAVSGVEPVDRTTWWLETAPVMIAVPLLLATHRKFPLTPLLQRLIFLHALVLMLGGHYTYAQTPVGFWVQEWFDLSRNPYDRLGHLMQGFVPAILTREILLRRSPLRPGKWLAFLCVCVPLAFSAFYELLEWWAALAFGENADAFLATQGDVWDTQWDMFLAMVGAIAALVTLSRLHTRQLRGMGAE